MKTGRTSRILAMLLLAAFLAGCGAPAQSAQAAEPEKAENSAVSAFAPDREEHRIEEKLFTTYVGSADETLTEPFPLYFADGIDDLPYVELRDWAELLYFLYHEVEEDEGYELTIFYNDDTVRLERENGYTLTFDFARDKLLFEDYDAFVHNSDDSTLIDLVSENGRDENGEERFIKRETQASFDRYGDVMIVDLDAYGIHMLAQDGKVYVPLQTLNDFTLMPLLVSFVFNGQALFLANDDLFFDYSEGSYSELAEIYYSAPGGERSDALAEYSYNELCLALDTFYGLKETHEIRGFRELFWQIGYDEVLSGNSAVDADNALKSFIDFYLDDLHSVFNEYSYLSGINPIPDSTGIANRKIGEHIDTYGAARKAAYPDGCPGYEEVGNTAYITFDSFTSRYSGGAFFDARDNGDELDDTVALILRAHERITRPGSPIENVVLDLSNNTGGAVDAAVVVLSWFLGEAPLSIKDMATGAMSNAVYRTDINLDQRFDEKDSVADRKLYCLISPVSFSCQKALDKYAILCGLVRCC